jgi:hypothetical protein
MQHNKIIQVFILVLMMLLSMWAISALLEARSSIRNVILGIGFFLILLTVLWRKIPLDAKLLFIVILGYALGGKGFAYVSPFEPIYIGEICLAICVGGILLRRNQLGLIDTAIHKLIWIFLIYSTAHLMLDFPRFQLLAIRDNATAYYSIFFFVAYVMFRNQLLVDTFEKLLKLAVVFSMMQFGHVITMWVVGNHAALPGFYPHPDAFIPLLGGASLFFLIKGIEYRKIHFLLLGVYATAVLCYVKTAAFLALIAVMGTSITVGRVKALMAPCLICLALGSMGIAVATIINPNFVIDAITGGDTAQAFGIEGGEFVGFSEASGTTSWRWQWWMLIWDDTMQTAPLWGKGFGSDISSQFLGDTEWGRSVRYPHNIMFTVIGRLGIIGLVIFASLFVVMGIHTLRFCRRFFQSPERRDADIIAFGVVLAGMINSVLQATYEVPYAAITHWVCLGYMAARYYKPQFTNDLVQHDEQEALSVVEISNKTATR